MYFFEVYSVKNLLKLRFSAFGSVEKQFLMVESCLEHIANHILIGRIDGQRPTTTNENDVFTDAFTDIFTDVSPFAIKIRFEICSKQLSTMRNRFLTLPTAENLHFNDFLTL